MSVLTGVEYSGDRVRLVVVDRQGRTLLRREEPLATPAELWWEGHPDERHRAWLGVVTGAIREAGLRPAAIAAIGLTAPPALVFLDPDLDPIPPRKLPWGDLDPESFRGRPWDALGALVEQDPAFARRIGVVLDLVGFIRYRLSGSLGLTVDFAWEGGKVRSPRAAASWDAPALEELGLTSGQLPPIFPAWQRVSVVGEDTIERTGMRRGTWISAGGDPRNTRLLFAAEPTPGRTVVLLGPDGAERWEAGPPPEAWSADVLPSAREGVFFHRRGAAGWDPRDGGSAPGSQEAVLDWAPGFDPELGPEHDDRLVAVDAGEASAGTAIIPGFGLGWWRDPRPLWRKRRPPRPLGVHRTEREEALGTASTAEATKDDPPPGPGPE